MERAGLHFPPGFRFHPTDEELVTHYLCRKCTAQAISVPIIAEIDLYKYNPWDLPAMASYGDKEWYFFSPRDRKYPNGSRPNRTAGSGYWKATGADKPIGHMKAAAIKKALVFYTGKAPKGEKTNWIMHEYRLANVDRSIRKKNSLRLDDWVLCRIYNKKGAVHNVAHAGRPSPYVGQSSSFNAEDQKPVVQRGDTHVENTDSVARLESSSSEQVVSLEFASEAESRAVFASLSPFNYIDASMEDTYVPQLFEGNNQMMPLQDMLMYREKLF